MWTSARPYPAFVKAATVSTPLAPLNVNAPPGTSSASSHRNVTVRIQPEGIIFYLLGLNVWGEKKFNKIDYNGSCFLLNHLENNSACKTTQLVINYRVLNVPI